MPTSKLTAEQWEKKAQFWSEQAAESKTFPHLMWCVELAQHSILKAKLAKLAQEAMTELEEGQIEECNTTHEMSPEDEEDQAVHMTAACIKNIK